jgi:hypothetical protein
MEGYGTRADRVQTVQPIRFNLYYITVHGIRYTIGYKQLSLYYTTVQI